MEKKCAACFGVMGLWQAAFTSECSHTFHLRCVSGVAACPSCAAPWRDVPTVTPAPGFSPFQPQPARTTAFGLPPGTANPFHLAQPRPCVVCHRAVGTGCGYAIVTSECHHTFHLSCISGSVCPVCNARWHDNVAARPTPSPTSSFFPTVQPQPPHPYPYCSVYDDDEPVEPPAHGAQLDGWDVVDQEAANGGGLVLSTHCEQSAVARGSPHDNFVVLVHAKAPGAAAAAATVTAPPLDLVTVLDVSGSMTGAKLALLKKAMEFVVDKLGHADRLSVVSFSSEARRIIPLTRMSDAGKVSAKCAVQSLYASGGTDILKGLAEAAKVLDGRRYRNAVASVILLSDGQDTYNLGHSNYGFSLGGNSSYGYCATNNYRDLVPRSLVSSAGNRSTPIHTFGFGVDHDVAAMHTIAEETGGTFSFIENEAVVQDSFAQCIGGLLSVAVQEAWISVTCLHPGVRVRAVKSGRYESRVDAYGRAASVDVGELYADEERRFLLLVDVPRAGDADDVTRLMKVSCTYRDTATGQVMDVAGEDAVVQRPVEVTDQQPSMEVARERFRVEVTEDIAAARTAAERGEHAEAARILDRRQEALLRSAPGLAGDARCAALVSELRELSARVANRREYEQTGRACLLAGMSSHAQQRAASAHVFSAMTAPSPEYGGACSVGAASSFSPGEAPAWTFGAAGPYATPAMQKMVDTSRKTREHQQQQPTTTPKSGSIFSPNKCG